MSILDWRIEQTPLAVLDIETTGVNPGFDRIVEASVIRLNPQSTQPELAFDSLLNPKCHIALTELHGIQQSDVASAPTFENVAAMLLEAVTEAVVVAHNVDFELRFLRSEFRRLGIDFAPPALCSMPRVFSWVLTSHLQDNRLDDAESHVLRQLRELLAQLGWSPGD